MSEQKELISSQLSEGVPISLPATVQEYLTHQFYQWEKRGRGWQVWDYPVELEPPFRPFFHYYPSNLIASSSYDDGRKPHFLDSFFVSLFQTIKDDCKEIAGLFRKTPSDFVLQPLSQVAQLTLEPDLLSEIAPEPRYSYDLTELQITLPASFIVKKEVAEQFLLSLSHCSYPLSFEVIGLTENVTVQLVCDKEDKAIVQQQLQAYFPEAVIRNECFFYTKWGNSKKTVIVDFGLANEFMLPLKTVKNFEVDPLIGIIGALSNLEKEELGMIQVIFQKTVYPWPESVSRSVVDWEGKPFFADAPYMATLAKEKIGHPLFSAVIRVASQSQNEARAWQIAKSLGAALTQFSNPSVNELIPLSNETYPEDVRQEDIWKRENHRTGMLLNSEELASLVHLPSQSVRSEKLRPKEQKSKLAPSIAYDGDLIIGENLHQGKKTTVKLNPDQRIKHTYIIGASGTGKSTLLLNLIVQDIKHGQGIAVLDPHGDLIDEILGHIPENRQEDVILFDPSDEQYPIGFNILSAHSELEKNLLSSDLVSVFRRLSTSWGDQMTSVLGNGILAFLESEEGGTLADLRRFLIEKEYRNSFLSTVKDQEVVYYWQREFPLLRDKPQAPILTRLDTFLRHKIIRYMVSQKENKINFASLMDEGKIFLAKLSQGLIGEENAYLLGSLLVSKFHQTAISRQEIKEEKRTPFYLYIDEFQDFVTPSMTSILSGARKYHLGLILAHQELRQIWSRNPDLASSVLANPYTRICFRLGDEDAKKLEEGFSYFDPKDLQNLGTGEAICRIEKSDYDFNLKTLPLSKIDQETEKGRSARIRTLSREKYGTKREEIEAELAKKYSPIQPLTIEKLQGDKKETVIEKPTRIIAAKVDKEEFILQERVRPHSMEDNFLGQGGWRHKYLQNIIKGYAEEKGFKVIIEKQIEDGRIDLVLEKNQEQSIACEISVTTAPEQELGNLEKCLAAGFQQIILISPERRVLNKVKELVVNKLNEQDMAKIQFFTPDEMFAFIEDQSLNKDETVIHGYKVRTHFVPVPEDDMKRRKQSIIQTIVGALRRLKGG